MFVFMGSLSCGEDSPQAQARRDAVASFLKLRLCLGMPASMVSLSQTFYPACCTLVSFARSVPKGIAQGAFWQSITSRSHPPSVWRRQIKGKGLVGEGQGWTVMI